jgi:hypothetical protein
MRRSKAASPKHFHPVQGYDTSDSECSTHLKASFVFDCSREYDECKTANVQQTRASCVSQGSYQDLFSESQSFPLDDWLDDCGYSTPMQLEDVIGDSQCHRSRLESLQGYKNGQSYPKHELEHEDFIVYSKNRNRVSLSFARICAVCVPCISIIKEKKGS